jgi:hypothetical protein
VSDARGIELAPLMTIDVTLHPIEVLGAVPTGERRCITFAGGSFAGRDGLCGTLASGGVDWQLARADGVIEIDAHYLLLSDQNEGIEVRSVGLRQASPTVAARLAAGEPVDPSEYYFRTHVRLSTAAGRLGWMNNLLAVGTGERQTDAVRIHVHQVL